MKRSLKTLVAGIATLTVLSIPIYAIGGSKEDVSELKEVVPQILTEDDVCYKTLEGKDHVYKVNASNSFEFELGVESRKSGKMYKFVDRNSDGSLDLFVGSSGYNFTPENTDAKRWKRLQGNYEKALEEILPLAKNILNERSSSLDEDLKDLE